MELSVKTAEGLATVPRDILKYIAAYNHKFSCRKEKDGSILYLVIKYADLIQKIELNCLRSENRKRILKRIEKIRFYLESKALPNEGINIELGRHRKFRWSRHGNFSLKDAFIKIVFPRYLVEPILRLLEERYKSETCDHCGKPSMACADVGDSWSDSSSSSSSDSSSSGSDHPDDQKVPYSETYSSRSSSSKSCSRDPRNRHSKTYNVHF